MAWEVYPHSKGCIIFAPSVKASYFEIQNINKQHSRVLMRSL
jgi:hypothetical protein